MTIRNPHNFSNWEFYIQSPQGDEVRLTQTTLYKLTELVVQQINVWDAYQPGFSDGAREEAKTVELTWYDYIKYSIQHQICLRRNGVATGLCWNDKIGSKLLALSKRIDEAVENSPGLIRKIGEGITRIATLAATGESKPKLSGCSTCGGRRTFQPSKSSLGRAGRMDAPKEGK